MHINTHIIAKYTNAGIVNFLKQNVEQIAIYIIVKNDDTPTVNMLHLYFIRVIQNTHDMMPPIIS